MIWRHEDMKTWRHDKQSLLSLHMKTKVVQHVPGINIKHLYDIMTSWHHDMKTWQHDKQSLLSLHMKTTRYMLHASRVTLSIWYMTAWPQISITAWQQTSITEWKRPVWQNDNRPTWKHDTLGSQLLSNDIWHFF